MQIKCDKCTGISKCYKSCQVHSGAALAKFLNGIRTVDAKIGEPYDFKGRNFVVSGHRITLGPKSQGGISGGVKATPKESTILDVTEILRLNGASAMETLKAYLDNTDVDGDFRKEIENKLRMINKHKLLIVPIELGENYDVEVVNTASKQKYMVQGCQATSVAWEADKQTGSLTATVVFAQPGKKDSVLKAKLADWGVTFKPVDFDSKLAGKNVNTQLLKMSNDGFFQPIELTDGKETVVIDGLFVYKITEYGNLIIGAWGANNKLTLNQKYKTTLEKVIKHNEWLLGKYKTYIAPFGFYKTNKVKITK